MSWTSLLIGTLVRDGRLTRQTTLGEIFDEDVWSDVDDAEAKRRITIEDLLQMESGYTDDGGYLGHVFGGLEGALDFGKYDASETGSFHYVNHHILSYVILELTGITPTALPCFGGGSGDTPSSPCPEPSRNLRGRR